MGRIITFNPHACDRTTDGKYNNRNLIQIIAKMVYASKCRQPNATARFIIGSFVDQGLVETYNDLGEFYWKMMIANMINHELMAQERNTV